MKSFNLHTNDRFFAGGGKAAPCMIDRIIWMLLSVLPSVFELSWTPVSAHFL